MQSAYFHPTFGQLVPWGAAVGFLDVVHGTEALNHPPPGAYDEAFVNYAENAMYPYQYQYPDPNEMDEMGEEDAVGIQMAKPWKNRARDSDLFDPVEVSTLPGEADEYRAVEQALRAQALDDVRRKIGMLMEVMTEDTAARVLMQVQALARLAQMQLRSLGCYAMPEQHPKNRRRSGSSIGGIGMGGGLIGSVLGMGGVSDAETMGATFIREGVSLAQSYVRDQRRATLAATYASLVLAGDTQGAARIKAQMDALDGEAPKPAADPKEPRKSKKHRKVVGTLGEPIPTPKGLIPVGDVAGSEDPGKVVSHVSRGPDTGKVLQPKKRK